MAQFMSVPTFWLLMWKYKNTTTQMIHRATYSAKNKLSYLLFLLSQLYRVYHLKQNQTTIMHCGTKMRSEAGPLLCNTVSQLPASCLSEGHLGSNAVCHSYPLHKRCAGAKYGGVTCRICVQSQTLQHIEITAVYKALRNAYPDFNV
jgi:hypothetical protein